MVDPSRHDVDLTAMGLLVRPDQPLALRPSLDAPGDLPVATLHSVTQTDGPDASILVACPDVHRHRVGVVQKQRVRLGDLSDVPTEVEQSGNRALAVHNTAGADRVAHALVHAVLQGDVDVRLERLQPALPDGADDVVGIGYGLATISCRLD